MIASMLTALLLPPLIFVLLALLGGLLAWRGRRWAGLAAALACTGVLLLSTPALAGLLRWSLEREVAAPMAGAAPGAIIVLGAEVTRGTDGVRVGALTLERLRAGAALHRRTGLPLLVTGGVLQPGEPALGRLMAASLAEDFRTPARWVEPRAANTRENAELSAAMLAAEGISAAHVVSHGWHLPRARDAFARAGFTALAHPLREAPAPGFGPGEWVPRPTALRDSWFALREWAGRLVYELRG
jgi:uncharacterized SAM-binding protein YcdF (DUF218 family)